MHVILFLYLTDSFVLRTKEIFFFLLLPHLFTFILNTEEEFDKQICGFIEKKIFF